MRKALITIGRVKGRGGRSLTKIASTGIIGGAAAYGAYKLNKRRKSKTRKYGN